MAVRKIKNTKQVYIILLLWNSSVGSIPLGLPFLKRTNPHMRNNFGESQREKRAQSQHGLLFCYYHSILQWPKSPQPLAFRTAPYHAVPYHKGQNEDGDS